MKFAIVGAGGVGGLMGARLGQAGHQVSYLARGANLQALREKGLHLRTPAGEFDTGPLTASDDPAALGVADVVLITTKLYDLESVARRASPLANKDTLVVPVQNGVEAHEILARALPHANVLKGTIYVSSFLTGPGQILQKAPFCRLRFASAAGKSIDAVAALAATLAAAPGIEAAVSPDIDSDLWKKFIMLAPFAAVSCLSRSDIGHVMAHAPSVDLLKQAMAEAIAVALAKKISLPDDIEAFTFKQMAQFPANAKPSMLEDIEAGRPIELEYLSGAIVRFGKALGIPTPVNDVAYRALSILIGGRKTSA